MKKITRGELGNILSAMMPTRTIHNREDQTGVEITDKWTVVFMEIDAGTLTIYVEAPTKK